MERDLLKLKAAALVLLSLCFSMGANAVVTMYSVWEGIRYGYDFGNKTAVVAALTDGHYTGDITIPSSIYSPFGSLSVTKIEATAFQNCTGLTSVSMPSTITTIEASSFLNDSSLTKVTLSDSVTTIGKSAFKNCVALSDINLPLALTVLQDSAFYASGLTSVKLPENVIKMGRFVFSKCANLKSFDTGETTNIIGEYMLANDPALSSLHLGANITEIKMRAFLEDKNLMTFTVPASVNRLAQELFHRNGSSVRMNKIVIEDADEGIKNMQKTTFYRCSPDTGYIGRDMAAVQGPASVYYLTIGPKVKSLDTSNGVFPYQTKYKVITLLFTDPTQLKITKFRDEVYAGTKLVVPDGTKAAFQADENWGKFSNIVEATEYTTGIRGVSADSNNAVETARYSIGGQAVGKQHKGLSIIRMSDGSVKKVVVK